MQTEPWKLHAAGDAVYVTPELEPEGAGAWFFTRLGGVSTPPFDALNVSTKVGDSEAAVSENRSRIGEALGGVPTAWVKQVAGREVVEVNGPGFHGEADAMITAERELALTVAIADCAPVVLVGDEGVGMVHSGWRGTLAGVSGNAVRSMGEPPSNLRAYVGPCIRRCCYEVSEELAARFSGRFGPGVVTGRQLSLPEAIGVDLDEAGVGEVYDLGLCTGCRGDLFFSHRKQGPATGRNLAVVSRRKR